MLIALTFARHHHHHTSFGGVLFGLLIGLCFVAYQHYRNRP